MILRREMGRLKYIFIFVLVIGLVGGLVYSIYNEDNPPSYASNGPIDPDWEPIYVDDDIGTFAENITYSFAELVDSVSPAVVSIITEKIEYDIFRQPYPSQGAGTGVIIDPKGYIVTNNHVVEDAETLTIVFSDGDSTEAEMWVGDSDNDLAVIKVEGNDFPYAHFLDDSLDKLSIGDRVMAIGNAGGRGIASTDGTISFLGETIQIDDVVLYDLVRTSAAINPGNSGGPLINMAGQVVGINVAINPEYENFGYAISTDRAIPIIEKLVISGYTPPAWLGVLITNVDNLTSDFKSQYDITVDSGAVIADEVVSGSPADKADLDIGDVIIEFGGVEITSANELVEEIQSHAIGDKVEIVYIRRGNEETTEATLSRNPSS